MSPNELGIEHKKLEDTPVATVRFNPKKREELQPALNELARNIPAGCITGPAFCITQFITSVTEGFDAEVGFPVTQAVEMGEIETRMLPAMEVLSLIHTGPVDELTESYRKLYRWASGQGLISDEFSREVFLDSNSPDGKEIEIQFVIHDWNRLLSENAGRVLGERAGQAVTQGSDQLTTESTGDERFRWVKGAVETLDGLANEDQRYDILSGCAHVFRRGQIEKLRAVYEEAQAATDDPLQAVDAVLDFMEQDPGWPERPRRLGHVIYSSKKPRDPQGYEKASNAAERRKAYCFCPLIRNHLDQGMPITFCYCGAGWYRQQWEGAVGRPVRIEVVKSVLKGDDVCQFAIHLPDDLG